jgi:N-methylhydantoinase A
MGYRVGVDIGGSFTDFAVFEESTNTISSLKVLSRPDQPGTEVMQGLRLLREHHGIEPTQILYFTHGTTVGVNSVIQRNGLRLALFATKGFSDVLELGRLKCPDMYSLLSRRPPALIPRELVFGLVGRLRADGTVETPLDEESVREAVRAALEAGAEGIVISLLHAYRNPAHELAAKAIVVELAPELPVFCSSETWPIIREYERTITATIGAYVQPRVANYLSNLQAALVSAGVGPEPRLTKSNGGVMTAEQGKRDCVQMILSGTASGVIGASYIARAAGIDRCMSLDVGGTSADVAIIIDGEPQFGVGETIGDYQIYIPSVSVTSIGDGGGSIAWVDSLGVLKVGPESAGSTPGPACYGRGGTRPTLTDAVVACGLMGQTELGYNSVQLDVEKARLAIGVLARQLGRSIEETADTIIRITISGMFSDVSGLLSRFGIDPRQFSLLAFGGAGPMLACLLARELGMKEVVVPTTPGVLSALGGLVGEIKNDFISTVYADLMPGAARVISKEFARLCAEATEWLEKDQGHSGPSSLAYSAEMRYRGQSFELETKLDAKSIESGDLDAMAAAFHAEHKRVYGHSDPTAPIQVIALRLAISGHGLKPELPRMPAASKPLAPGAQATARLDGQSVNLSL